MLTRILPPCFVLALLAAFTGCAGSKLATNERVTEIESLSSRIDELVSGAYPDADAPGCAVLVRLDGRDIFARGYGRAFLESMEPNTPQTNFRLASVSKQFTAAATLRLVQSGDLSLDDSLDLLFPDFPAYGDPITVRHLLTHTSGLKDYENLMPADTAVPILDAGVLELLAQQQVGDFPPGDRYAYSNSGYAVLAQIVEKKSGISYAAFLHREFFGPLAMEGTVAFERGVSEVPRRAYGYKKNPDGTWLFADQSMTSSVLGDGGIYSSVESYATWADAWFSGKVLPPELQQLAWTPGRLNDGSNTEYGMGWRIETVDGQLRVNHTGSSTGFNNYARLVPDRKLCVVILANRNGTEPAELVPRIEELVLAAFSGE